MICFMNDNPQFYAEVEIDGVKVATVKAKTHSDSAEIQRRCYHKKIVDNNLDWDIDFVMINIIRIRQALTGDSKVGWDSEKPVTEENISLLPPEIFGAILAKINELDKSWQDGEIEKN